ncbi:hypothetical protein [[Eubacterium] cellulosolvens]
MAKDWKSELKEIVTSQQNKIKTVIDDRNKREAERIKKIDEIKKIIKPRLEYIGELIEADKYLLSTFEEEPPTASAEDTETDAEKGIPPQHVPSEVRDEFIDTSRRGERVAKPKIKESPTELVLIMPALSDVNRLDLMYQIEFREGKPVLHAFDLLSAGKMKNNGSAHDNFEDFVQDTLKRFLLSWFTRKEGTELDKERTFKLVIEPHGMRP